MVTKNRRQKSEGKKSKGSVQRTAYSGQESKVRSEQIKAIITELETLAAAEAQTDIFEKYPKIKAAWERVIARYFEEIFKSQLATPVQSDYRKVTLRQLIEITGRGRRTIYDWIKKGLPREADSSFDLAKFIEWFERYTIEKLPAQVVTDINPLQKMKAQRLSMDLDRQRNQLLDRGEVMAGQIARHQNLINAFSHKAEELMMLIDGQPKSKGMEILNNFLDEVLSRQCQVPEFLRLPEDVAKEFMELLKRLRPEGE